MSAAIFQAVQADGRIMVYGGTYDYREAIRTHGGKWNAAEKAWYLPAGTDTSFLPPLPVVVVAPKPVVAVYAPRRRDGRCCDKATAFFPSDDPYAHYGPLHYRCESHGVSRSNYSGT
jgi:hypothetical protein